MTDVLRSTFEDFFRTTHPGAVSFARCYISPAHLAEDVAEDAYLRLWRCWPRRQGKPAVSNRNYLLTTIRHEAIRTARRHGPPTGQLHRVHDLPSNQHDVAAAVTDEMALRAFLATLSPRQRAVGVLSVQFGMTAEEIGPILKIEPSTVRTHAQKLGERAKRYYKGQEEGDG